MKIAQYKYLSIFSVCCCLIASIISLNHIFGYDNVVFNTVILGVFGWIALLSAIFLLSFHLVKELLIVWIFFFGIGLFCGPYLEPPADPMAHLDRIQDVSAKKSSEIRDLNRGLWHYTMLNLLINVESSPTDAIAKLRRVEITHAIVFAFLLSSIYILSKRIGLKPRWAFFSCAAALLFMGTNRFSYFTYYTFAPSATSLIIYWLWAAYFFMKNSLHDSIKGVLFTFMILPILLTNHIQEGVFLVYLTCIWLLVNIIIHCFVVHENQNHGSSFFHLLFQSLIYKCRLLLLLIFFLLFVLPQFDIFTDFMSSLFFRKQYNADGIVIFWKENSELVREWGGVYLGGKIWGYRVNETFSGIGVVISVLSIIFFWPGFLKIAMQKKIKIVILSILPFFVYFIPLFHFFWTANVWSAEYYRLGYSSMFWIFFGFLFQQLECKYYMLVTEYLTRRKINPVC